MTFLGLGSEAGRTVRIIVEVLLHEIYMNSRVGKQSRISVISTRNISDSLDQEVGDEREK